ncbi:hypothetical protein [Metapseudomonas otitidis]|uniref:hypothetical protein n=1 Tax=Metapseudomonas otitidis TaxID=319939 RepID=UPI0020975F7D|nr:hypothetical protein [Pseudomonas otitidis]MCO7552348.1 hypothetical protein [Pseudomonas otitidis]
MTISRLLATHERESLYTGANYAIWNSHHLAGRLSKSTAREEDFVATLVTDGIPLLAERWGPLLHSKGVALKLSGVFCHGHPQVSFGSPPSRVELADLLIVHQHTKATRVSARAMLLQAKMSSDSTHRLSPSDPQLQLFSKWPLFEFVTGGLPAGFRDLKEVGKGSRYALVLNKPAYPEEITWADQCPWVASPAVQHLTADRSLARVLGDMLLHKDGRPFQTGKPKDDWSKTIQDLLQITGQRTYRRANIKRGHTPRLAHLLGNSVGLMLMCEHVTPPASRAKSLSQTSVIDRYFGVIPTMQEGGHELDPPRREQNVPPDGGISTLIIETTALDG